MSDIRDLAYGLAPEMTAAEAIESLERRIDVCEALSCDSRALRMAINALRRFDWLSRSEVTLTYLPMSGQWSCVLYNSKSEIVATIHESTLTTVVDSGMKAETTKLSGA